MSSEFNEKTIHQKWKKQFNLLKEINFKDSELIHQC